MKWTITVSGNCPTEFQLFLPFPLKTNHKRTELNTHRIFLAVSTIKETTRSVAVSIAPTVVEKMKAINRFAGSCWKTVTVRCRPILAISTIKVTGHRIALQLKFQSSQKQTKKHVETNLVTIL